MKQGRIARALALALTLAVLGVGGSAPLAHAAAKTVAKSPRKAATLHQFSGVVTAVDKTSLTVEKGGKSPKSMTFERRADMTMKGELERDAHVTVYYRDEDGRSVAHRVVVKEAGPSDAK